MYATIRRYKSSGALTAELISAKHQVSAVLAREPGFVSFDMLEGAKGGFAWVFRFDDEGSLANANRRAVEWLADSLGGLVGTSTEVLTGEVIVRRGL